MDDSSRAFYFKFDPSMRVQVRSVDEGIFCRVAPGRFQQGKVGYCMHKVIHVLFAIESGRTEEVVFSGSLLASGFDRHDASFAFCRCQLVHVWFEDCPKRLKEPNVEC